MPKYGVVNTDILNLRAGPSTTSAITSKLTTGAVLEVLSDLGTGWLDVRVDGTSTRGYVSKQYVTLTDTKPNGDAPAPSPQPGTAPAGAIGRAEVITDSLNVRTGPGTTFKVITGVPKGTVLYVLEIQGDWVKVKLGNNEGFCSKQYLDLNTTKTPSGYLIENTDLIAIKTEPEKRIPEPPSNTKESVIARTWNNYGGLLSKLATMLKCPLNGVVATLAAESGGNCFGPDGRTIIRFENHIFWREWGKEHADQFNQFFKFDPASGWKGHYYRSSPDQEWRIFHGKQSTEYEVLTVARALDDTAALFSISMGAPQIMGFNYRRLGYENVQSMFYQFSRSANAQLLAMFDFVRGTSSESPAIRALRSGDYYTFALNYNGSGNAKVYQNIIATYAGIFDRLIQTAK